MEIARAAEHAGIVGASGSGHPLHLRLLQRVDTVVANGAECEPLLATDRLVMERHAPEVLEGLSAAMAATGAARGILALRVSQRGAWEALRRAAAGMAHLELRALPEVYPIGDAHLLVPEVTGRRVPEGGRPEGVGVLVANVHTLLQLRRALEGEVVTRRYVTVGGEVARPGVYEVPVGTLVEELVALCGGVTTGDPVFVLGGPMQGALTQDGGQPVTRATGGVFVFPADHPLMVSRRTGLTTQLQRAASVCGSCRQCTERCPRHELGHALEPHMLVRTLTQGVDLAAPVLAAPLCSGCGVCEVVCPAGLSPRSMLQAVKSDLALRGFSGLPPRHGVEPTGDGASRRLPREEVLARAGLARYAVEGARGMALSPDRVVVPLGGPGWAAAEPCVRVGQKVGVGEVLARPRVGEVGAWAHASMPGEVARVDTRGVELRSQGIH